MSDDSEPVDVPLWERDEDLEQTRGICSNCGELTNDWMDTICDRCWEAMHK